MSHSPGYPRVPTVIFKDAIGTALQFLRAHPSLGFDGSEFREFGKVVSRRRVLWMIESEHRMATDLARVVLAEVKPLAAARAAKWGSA
jgi:hypothetical protein